MNPAQAAALLGVCAAFDYRKPDESKAMAWAAALSEHSFEDCRDAVVAYYKAGGEFIKVGDVERFVANRRWSRIQALGYVQPPRELTDAQEGDWLRALNSAAGDGLTREAAIDSANLVLGIDPEPLELTHKVSDVLRQIETKRDPRSRPRDGVDPRPKPHAPMPAGLLEINDEPEETT